MAIDFGLSLGWARCENGEPPIFGTEELPRCGDDLGILGLALKTFLLNHFRTYAKPDLVGFAVPLVMGPHQAIAQRKLLGMSFLAETVCAESDIATAEEWESTMRNAFLAPDGVPSKSPQIKAAIMARCLALGWDTKGDDDAADALCVLDWFRVLTRKGWPSAAERSGLFGQVSR